MKQSVDTKNQVTHINIDADIAVLITDAKPILLTLGFIEPQISMVISAASELATNILKYGGRGRITIKQLEDQAGVRLIAEDNGPGIADIERAMSKGFSSSGTLGFGLPGVKLMSDEFHIESSPDDGTTVKSTILKWSTHAGR